MKNVYENSIAFSLSQHKIGIKRKVDSARITVDEKSDAQPDKNLVSVSKELLKCKEFDAIGSMDGLIRKNLMNLAVPAPFKDGIYLIPLVSVQKIDSMIETYKQDRQKLVDKFIDIYVDAILEAKTRLGVLFNENDYPAIEKVKESFSVSTSYLDLNVPGRLQTINPAIFEKERKIFTEKLENAALEIQTKMREALADLVSHMVDRLTPGEDGKQKIFRDSAVGNLKEFLQNFRDRNISDDSELQAIVDKANELLGSRSPQSMRDNNAIAEEVKTGLSTIKSQLDLLVTTAKSRKFNFEEN
jgi:hypothetical protein